VASLHGGLGSRESDGAIVLAVMVVLAAAAALVTARFERRSTDQPLPRPRRLGLAAAAVVGLAVVGLIVGGLNEKVSSSELARANSARLTSVESNRYEYWRVGWLAFKDHPLKGLGSGGFQVLWLEKRRIREGVQQVHSIELEMAAELGIVGLLGFGLMVGGTGVAARRALRRDRVLAAGMLAALVTWLLHASIDWDWQMPAVSLPAIALAGALIALGEADAAPAAVRELPEDRAAARPRAPA
jgi:O-antigen ligase